MTTGRINQVTNLTHASFPLPKGWGRLVGNRTLPLSYPPGVEWEALRR